METGSKSFIELGLLTEDEVVGLGEKLANCLNEGDILLLSGEIGSGKTTFVRGFVKGLGCCSSIVTSPTFTLMNVYNCTKKIFHIDAYRLNGIEEAFFVLEGELERRDGIFIIEWGELIVEFFNDDTINIRFEHVDEKRRRLTLITSEDRINFIRRCI
ncbi:MAG: tRNA (adenosine(37)-N6)-threonylcarbamoyltransferase complex ATPase subunit type 1 TsaE [Fervidobacterium sp.]